MLGEASRLNPLEARKQLLVAESELNRAHLLEEWHAIGDELHNLAGRAKTISAFASATAFLIAGLAALRRAKAGPDGPKRTWFRTLLGGAQFAASLWLARRTRPRTSS